jgi:hypothetical protein
MGRVTSDAESVYEAPRWLRRVRVWHVVALVSAAAIVAVTSRLWLGCLPDSLVYRGEFREARAVIKRIDDFALARHALPADLCALGLPCDESAPLHYEPNNGGYSLWFSAPTHGFFCALAYDSISRTWHVTDG